MVARAVWGHKRDLVAVFKAKAGGDVFGKCLLGDVDREFTTREPILFKQCSKEEVGVSHEVRSDFVVEKMLEAGLLRI